MEYAGLQTVSEILQPSKHSIFRLFLRGAGLLWNTDHHFAIYKQVSGANVHIPVIGVQKEELV
jgi:hypothetical protein